MWKGVECHIYLTAWVLTQAVNRQHRSTVDSEGNSTEAVALFPCPCALRFSILIIPPPPLERWGVWGLVRREEKYLTNTLDRKLGPGYCIGKY